MQGAEPRKDKEGGQGGLLRALLKLLQGKRLLASSRGTHTSWDPTSRQRNSNHPHPSPSF